MVVLEAPLVNPDDRLGQGIDDEDEDDGDGDDDDGGDDGDDDDGDGGDDVTTSVSRWNRVSYNQ